jgi:homopolymeric O-antigen transport system ATP-binding protein
MQKNAIVVENLSKRYLIGHRFASRDKWSTLRDVVGREFRNFTRKAADVIHGRQVVQGDEIEEFWALKDVNFEVKQGEVLGLIGRNGAGKSTLLKILSRITEPTNGRISLNGRVASLLEVGTGFHPELTGRENIFLNGAILGMTQREISKKFDEIVTFAEVEKFLETPVKHYSSGMYVRLAFAVAAHLEPEILIVDEVLAVGDAEFQKKCLGKMDESSRKEGRTVLFVSHNMEVILKLCTRGIFFESGSITTCGDVKEAVATYLRGQPTSPRVVDLSDRVRPPHCTGIARVIGASTPDANSGWSLPFGQHLSLDVSINAPSSVTQVGVTIALFSARGFEIATWSNKFGKVELSVRPGANTFRIQFQNLRLLPGQYSFGISLRDGRGGEDYVHEAVLFEITSTPEAAEFDADTFRGAFVPSGTISIIQ